MLTVYSDSHLQRQARTELYGGRLIPPHECPERAGFVLGQVRATGLGEVVGPRPFGMDPIRRVHEAGYLDFLASAWEEWSRTGYQGEAIPTCWPARRMVQRRPTHIDGKLGYYAASSETSISAGSWEAALPETYFTVWANLFQRGGLRAGERVLVHGGTSGIGVTAVQLAVAFGAEVFATVGSDAKAAACRALGASVAINYRTMDFVSEIERLTDGRGVDVVLDMVGAPYFARNIRCLARDGRLIQIAFLEGAVVERFDLTPVMTKRLTVTGSTMRPRTSAEKALIAADLRAKVWPVLDRGLCKPPIYATFPLAKAAEAHALMESSQHIGKIVLLVGG